jgi:hypothetical protein
MTAHMHSPYLNQIFYKCNKFDKDSIQKLIPYMLTLQNMNKIKELFIENVDKKVLVDLPSQLPKPETVNSCSSSSSHKNKSLFFPQRENALFWCAFISFHGMAEYEIIQKKYSNQELAEKQKIIEFIKKNPQHLKLSNHKITNGLIQEILSDLMTNLKSNLLTFIGMTHYYNKFFYIVKGHTYLYFAPNEANPEENISSFFIIHCKNEREYGIDLDTTFEKINHIQTNYISMESIEKPLKGISAYKMTDLIKMCKKMELNNDIDNWESKKKPDLYKYLWEKCLWK